MAEVSVTKTIYAPADKVWEMVSEWGGTHKWIPGVGVVTVEGEGVGSTRSADLDPATGFPGRISERLESLDPDGMHLEYRVVGNSPLPVTDYVAEMSVVRADSETSTVTWSCTWQADGLPEDEIHDLLEGLYNIALDNVNTALS